MCFEVQSSHMKPFCAMTDIQLGDIITYHMYQMSVSPVAVIVKFIVASEGNEDSKPSS